MCIRLQPMGNSAVTPDFVYDIFCTLHPRQTRYCGLRKGTYGAPLNAAAIHLCFSATFCFSGKSDDTFQRGNDRSSDERHNRSSAALNGAHE